MSNNRKLEYVLANPAVEAELFRAGREAYLVMLAQSTTHALNVSGGIGPYEFSGRVEGSLFCFEAREL